MTNKYDNEFERLKRLNRIKLFKSKCLIEAQKQTKTLAQVNKSTSLEAQKAIFLSYRSLNH
ncbi:MAG: hypothetical protein AB7U85_05300 [Alphaproteobacteria bacterium]